MCIIEVAEGGDEMVGILNEKQNLRFWRRLRDLTQKELAEKVGVTPKMIYYYEADNEAFRRASFETVSKIADVLGITVDDINFF